jgi:cytochrome d ubiquinol oxidase subunit I
LLEVIFNPSFPYCFTHMMLAQAPHVVAFCGCTAGCVQDCADVIASLENRCVHLPSHLLQIGAGLLRPEHRWSTSPPNWRRWKASETQCYVPAVLFALPDEKIRTNRYEIAIPKSASVFT